MCVCGMHVTDRRRLLLLVRLPPTWPLATRTPRRTTVVVIAVVPLSVGITMLLLLEHRDAVLRVNMMLLLLLLIGLSAVP